MCEEGIGHKEREEQKEGKGAGRGGIENKFSNLMFLHTPDDMSTT